MEKKTSTMTRVEPHPASFRDPSGFLFTREGVLYRQINQSYAQDYIRLMESGLYERLVKAGLLVRHAESDQPWPESESPREGNPAFRVIIPERVPFISHPYEWCFSQLRDAALATLSIQKRALKYDLTLKDASAYNIQFLRGKPVLIDTLSFEAYREGQPWVPYRQFCQHFLAPLALMAYRDVRLIQLLRIHIDGLPLDLVSRLLPFRSRLQPGLLIHIHLHANAQRKYAGRPVSTRRGMNRSAMIGLIESLEGTIRRLTWRPHGTEWGDYYGNTNYSDTTFEHKRQLVREWVQARNPSLVWDLGGNTGIFSRAAAACGAYTVSFDVDPAAVERNYLEVKADQQQNLLPLVLDLTNPSPGLGWNHRERDSLSARGPAEMVLALALIHHLAISNNVPLLQLAEYFAEHCRWLVIEFVPKSDSQVRRLLTSRADIFPDYTRAGFESAFMRCFNLRSTVPLRDSERIMYLMEVR
jgi:hypothetical protein